MEWNYALFETEKSALNHGFHSSPTNVGTLVTPLDSIDIGNSILPAINLEPFSNIIMLLSMTFLPYHTPPRVEG